MRRSVIALTVLILSAIGAPAGNDGIVLSLSGSENALTLDWVGGLPSYQLLRGSSASSAADIENLRVVTAANQHTETRLRPGKGEGLYYLVQSTTLASGTLPGQWIDGTDCSPGGQWRGVRIPPHRN